MAGSLLVNFRDETVMNKTLGKEYDEREIQNQGLFKTLGLSLVWGDR